MAKAFLLPIVISCILLGISGCAGLGSKINTLQMLHRLGRDDKLKQRALNRETANFQRLKNYIDSNRIKKGISVKSAIKKFGEPVLSFAEEEGERWVYKAADADWIDGEKIYLFFDKKGGLIGWECVNNKLFTPDKH